MSTRIKAAQLQDYVGQETGVSDWFQVTQERIDEFADATLDHQFIHIDPERATPIFGSTIAHGFLSLSLLPHLSQQSSLGVENTVMGINYGLDKLRFLSPVPAGAEVRLRSKLMEVTERGEGQYLLKVENTMEIKGVEKPALVAHSLSLIHVSEGA
ncbi:MAG: MaoC family dehydratase [Gammaproteobacteria bacterium AqS3]|nr:MaoC family dehydratase [Gammaproteobacteria bacterium AqS3]